jgi:DNA repair exonuclease SbcCD ATPase subunit
MHKQRWRNATYSTSDLAYTPHADQVEDAEVLSWLQGSNLTVGQLHSAKAGLNGHITASVAHTTGKSAFETGHDHLGRFVAGQLSPTEHEAPVRRCATPPENGPGSMDMDALRRLVRSELECERLSGEAAALRRQAQRLEAENETLRADLSRAVERSHTAIDAAMEASQIVAGERDQRRRRRRERDLLREAEGAAAVAESLRDEKNALERERGELERELLDARRTAQDARHQVSPPPPPLLPSLAEARARHRAAAGAGGGVTADRGGGGDGAAGARGDP